MRKYHQLILFIISILSVTCLLIYRHEYYRLRNVLEVFNFFGQPNQCSISNILNASNTIKHNWEPIPVWTTVEDFHIYSAFFESETDVETLIIHNDKKIAIKTCYLWFENQSKPSIGKITYSKIQTVNDINQLTLYKYHCHIDAIVEVPYAVSFTNKNRRAKELKKIMIYPLSKTKYQLTTACVIPSSYYSKQNILEFISFYKIIGVDSFIIYNNNIPYKLTHMLEQLSSKLGIEIINFPWNYPDSIISDVRTIAENDCLQRTKDKSRNVLILDWSEFFVPRHHHTVSSLLNDYDPKNQTQLFSTRTLTFCTNFHEHRDPAIIHSIYYDETMSSDTIFIHRNNNPENNIINTQEISSEVAAIHRYIPCSINQAESKIDDTMSRFSADLQKSILFQLYDQL